MKQLPGKITSEEALQKAEQFCSIKECSKQEIRNRLIKWTLSDKNIANIIQKLVTENYINENRFALSYYHDKIRINKWGTVKIKSGLRAAGIPDEAIQSASEKIDTQEYYDMIEREIQKKVKQSKTKDVFRLKAEIFRFSQSRGYELSIVSQVMKTDFEKE